MKLRRERSQTRVPYQRKELWLEPSGDSGDSTSILSELSDQKKQGQVQLHGSLQSYKTPQSEGPELGLVLYSLHLEILKKILTSTLHFHLPLDLQTV